MPEISVIVPVYKVENFLPRCVDSILTQTFSDFELILVDDGSPDSCGQICDEYAKTDSRVKVIHKENGGVCVARNTALDSASGEYIAFCDSDDYFKPEWLETLIKEANAHNADFVCAGYSVATDEGITRSLTPEDITIATKSDEDKLDHICDILGPKYGWEIWTRLFKADIIKKNNIRFCTTCKNFAEDMAFVIEFVMHASVLRYFDFAGYCYYLRTDSMMRTSENVVKLDELNEISVFLEPKFKSAFKSPEILHLYPIVNYLVMNNQYEKLTYTQKHAQLEQEILKIKNRKFHKTQAKKILRLKKELKEKFGKKTAMMILLFSRYCVHGNYKRYCIESAVVYKFFRG